MADRQGFEPWRRFPAYTRSRRAPSTTRPPVREGAYREQDNGFQAQNDNLGKMLFENEENDASINPGWDQLACRSTRNN